MSTLELRAAALNEHIHSPSFPEYQRRISDAWGWLQFAAVIVVLILDLGVAVQKFRNFLQKVKLNKIASITVASFSNNNNSNNNNHNSDNNSNNSNNSNGHNKHGDDDEAADVSMKVEMMEVEK